MKNDVINLIATTEEYDDDGFLISDGESFEVFADVKTATRSEAYQSSSINEKVVLVASVNYDDYDQSKNKPNRVEYDGVMYKIVRVFRKRKENSIELSLSEVE